MTQQINEVASKITNSLGVEDKLETGHVSSLYCFSFLPTKKE